MAALFWIVLIIGFIGLAQQAIIGIIAALKSVVIFITPIVIAVVSFMVIREFYRFFTGAEQKEKELENKQKKERDFNSLVKMKLEQEKRYKEKLAKNLHRDCDQQDKPYIYEISQHGNESLAIRYGIANFEKKTKEYWYFAKGGEKKRNLHRDKVYYEPANTIRLQKTKRIDKNLYEVMLVDYRNRKAKAIIEVGTEYVKTFYPLDNIWFEKHADIELTLKGNGSFTLKELATFHVNKTMDL